MVTTAIANLLAAVDELGQTSDVRVSRFDDGKRYIEIRLPAGRDIAEFAAALGLGAPRLVQTPGHRWQTSTGYVAEVFLIVDSAMETVPPAPAPVLEAAS